eukprot:854389-Amphidinium_carterae.1
MSMTFEQFASPFFVGFLFVGRVLGVQTQFYISCYSVMRKGRVSIAPGIHASGGRTAPALAEAEQGSIETCAAVTVWCATLAWRRAFLHQNDISSIKYP